MDEDDMHRDWIRAHLAFYDLMSKESYYTVWQYLLDYGKEDP